MLEEIMRQSLVPFDTPLEDEPTLSWEYFQHYRDLGPGRTKAALVEIIVQGKTRKAGQFTTWAKKFRWDFRAHAYDMENVQKAHEEAVLKRDENLGAYIGEDLDTASELQELCRGMFQDMAKARARGEKISGQELRAVAWVYRESRLWVKDTLVFTYGDGRTPAHHN